ncbi:MAG: DnaJ domain-containing protein [Phycisphaera sp.]|nr:DnaJ domain-containing protein [Phycisphaera sp.]
MDDPFDVLGLEPRYDLDDRAMHRRYIEQGAANHPDRFTDPLDQADAAERTARLNEAYRVLKSPELRAEALMARWGGSAKGDDKSLPPELLMEVMETRESMEEAKAGGNQKKLDEIARWARDQREEALRGVAELLTQAGPMPQADRPPLLARCRVSLNVLRYFDRMIDEAKG